MPRMRAGYRQLATLVTAEAMEAIEAVAAQTGRSIAEEVNHALLRHAAAPPSVRVDTPPLPPAEVEVPARRRGRPRKGG